MRNKLRLAFFGGFSLLVVALIAFAVLHHEEPGLLGACFDGSGKVSMYEQDGAQKCPELRWPGKRTLTVYAYTANEHLPGDPQSIVNGACQSFNTQVGFKSFALGERDDADVVIVMGVAHDESWGKAGGRTQHRRAGDRLYAMVETSNEGDAQQAHLRVLHELGHVRGLAHDPWPDSAMHISSASGRLSDSDAELMHALYHQ